MNAINRTHLLVFPDLSSDVIAMLEFIDEALASVVEEETTNTTESLSGQELDFGVGLLGVDQAGRMNLDLLEIDGRSADVHGELLAVTSAMLAVGGGEIPVLGAMLLEERVLSKIGGVATSSENDRAVGGFSLTAADVFDTDNCARLILDELRDASLLVDLNALRAADR